MREIKFRVWHKDIKQMIYSDLIGVFIGAGGWVNTAESNGMTLMQFTGLYDNNAKEIFESDIVIFIKNESKELYVIEYETGSSKCGFYATPAKYLYDERFSDYCGGSEKPIYEVKVVGNVFEMPLRRPWIMRDDL